MDTEKFTEYIFDYIVEKRWFCIDKPYMNIDEYRKGLQEVIDKCVKNNCVWICNRDYNDQTEEDQENLERWVNEDTPDWTPPIIIEILRYNFPSNMDFDETYYEFLDDYKDLLHEKLIEFLIKEHNPGERTKGARRD